MLLLRQLLPFLMLDITLSPLHVVVVICLLLGLVVALLSLLAASFTASMHICSQEAKSSSKATDSFV